MHNIILYSTGCPACMMLKKKLEEANIKYEENNDTNLMISKGFTTVPQLEVDGIVYGTREALKWIGENKNE